MDFSNYMSSVDDLNGHRNLGSKSVTTSMYTSSATDPFARIPEENTMYFSADHSGPAFSLSSGHSPIPPASLPIIGSSAVSSGSASSGFTHNQSHSGNSCGNNQGGMVDHSLLDFNPYQSYSHSLDHQDNDTLPENHRTAGADPSDPDKKQSDRAWSFGYQGEDPLHNRDRRPSTVMNPMHAMPASVSPYGQTSAHYQNSGMVSSTMSVTPRMSPAYSLHGMNAMGSPMNPVGPSGFSSPPNQSFCPPMMSPRNYAHTKQRMSYPYPYSLPQQPQHSPSSILLSQQHQHHYQHQHQPQTQQRPHSSTFGQRRKGAPDDFLGDMLTPLQKKPKSRKRKRQVDPNAPPRPKRKTGLNKPLILSPALSELMGGDRELSRPEIVKKLWKYIKDNNLQDPVDRRFILCDDKLKSVFAQDRVNSFGMNRDLSAHLTKKEEDPSQGSQEQIIDNEKTKDHGENGEPNISTVAPTSIDLSPSVTADTPDVMTPKEGESVSVTATSQTTGKF